MPNYVICIDNSDYPASLEKRKIYQVVPDSRASATGCIRIVDESGEDYMYPASRFVEARLTKAVEEAIAKAV